MEFILTFLMNIMPGALAIALVAACIIILFDLLFLYRKRLAALDSLTQTVGSDITDAKKSWLMKMICVR